MNHPTRRKVLQTAGLTLCSGAFFGEMAGQALSEETVTPSSSPGLEPPPVAPGESRAAQVKWYAQYGLSPGRRLLAVYGNIYGITPGIALKLMGGMSGGGGHSGEMCSTVIAAIILLGLKNETADVAKETHKTTHAKVIALAKQFIDDVREKHQSVVCRELIQCDISTPEKYALSKETPDVYTVCYKSLDTIIDLLENKYDILNREKENN